MTLKMKNFERSLEQQHKEWRGIRCAELLTVNVWSVIIHFCFQQSARHGVLDVNRYAPVAYLVVFLEIFLHEDDILVLHSNQDVNLLEDIFPCILIVTSLPPHFWEGHDLDGKLFPAALVCS